MTPENEEEASETEVLETEAPLPEFSEITVVDNEFCSIKITGIEEDALFGYTLNSLLENKSSEITYMSWSDTTLEENDITEVNEIQFTLSVRDANDWMADDIVNETIVLNP